MQHKTSIQLNLATFGYHKSKHPIQLLSKVSATFNAGDFIGVVGLNGIGKSTFIKTLCGLLPLLHGEILLEGKSLNDFTFSELSKIISIVLTEKIEGFNLTAYDLVASGQMPYTNAFHALQHEHKKIIEEAIQTCGIKEHQNKLLPELSDGLFQKSLIAKALAQQTPIMLLDEPSAFLDYASKHELFLLLKQLCLEQHKCILVSSHDLDLLLKYCPKLLVLSNHRAELINSSEALTHNGFKAIGGQYIK